MGKLHTSMRGREVDMDKLNLKFENVPAVGNAKVDARGDELGPGGQVVKKREETINEYYESNPKARKEVEPVKTKTDVKIEEQSTKRTK
jgi:hypothetical protein